MVTSCSLMSPPITATSLCAEATVKLPLRATSPTRAEYQSSNAGSSCSPKNIWSSRGTDTTLSSSRCSSWLECAMPATISPIATPVIRSTNTVSPSVTSITIMCSRRR